MLAKGHSTPIDSRSRVVDKENGHREEVESREEQITCQEREQQVRDRVETLEKKADNMNFLNKNRSQCQTRVLELESSEFPIGRDVSAFKSDYDSNAHKQNLPMKANRPAVSNRQLKQHVDDVTSPADTSNHHHHAHRHHQHSCLGATKLVNAEPPAAPTQIKHHHQQHCMHHNQNHLCHRHLGVERPNSESRFRALGAEQNSRQHHLGFDKSYVLVEYRAPQQVNEHELSGCKGSERLQDITGAGRVLHNNKRTTMRFISQLYFLIHLSALLSLLLHHKNLVASERKLLLCPLEPSAAGKFLVTVLVSSADFVRPTNK